MRQCSRVGPALYWKKKKKKKKVKVISLAYIFQVLYVLCFTNVNISGERLQDQWSSGILLSFTSDDEAPLLYVL